MTPEAGLPGFVPASEIPLRNLSREEELEEEVRQSKAETMRVLELLGGVQAERPATTGPKPQEWQALQTVISDLLESNKELQTTAKKQALQIDEMRDRILRLLDRVDQLQESLNLEIALDRQRIKKLEGVEDQQPKQKDRSDTLRLLLAAKGGKMLAKDARHRLGLSEAQFSQLLKSMSGLVESRPLHSDRRQHVITLVKALTNNSI